MVRNFLYIVVFLFVCVFDSLGQAAYANFNRDYYHQIERYEILRGNFSPSFQTGFKPYRRDHIATFIETIHNDSTVLSQRDRFNLAYLRQDNWEFFDEAAPASKNAVIGTVYKTPSDFFYYRDKSFDVHVNPVLYLHAGGEQGESMLRFRNTRGVEVRGSIDRKIGIYTFLATTDLRFPSWVRDYAVANGAVPGEGFWKRYDNLGYSFFSATGYLTFQATEHVALQFGQDRNFVGEGYRSMVLSDFSNPYIFFKANTKIWKLNLTNLWAQMNADVFYDRGFPTDGRYPQKWFTYHRLSADLGKRLNIGVFESVMANKFDWNYLNPLIFYRWVEHQLGSPDKVMLGTDLKWNMGKGLQVYAQFALDEFVFSEFFGIDGRQSSRNKYGLQAGLKAIEAFGIPHLDLQFEYNQARPYTYQEKFEYQSFSNYRTPLTHPLGANFREGISIIRYQPYPRLHLQGMLLYQYFGKDPDADANFGGDVRKNRTVNSTSLFGNYIGQGVPNRVATGNLLASYMFRHNLFMDVSYTYRRRNLPTTAETESTGFLQGSLRFNIVRHDYNF